MKTRTRPELAVTLSPELYLHLRAESKRLNVPLEWLVASLVCDTVEHESPEAVMA